MIAQRNGGIACAREQNTGAILAGYKACHDVTGHRIVGPRYSRTSECPWMLHGADFKFGCSSTHVGSIAWLTAGI
jgi:hypothetical protein